MRKGKIKDFLSAAKEETTDIFLSSDVLPGIIQSVGETVVSEGTAMIIGEVAGAVIPGINGIILSYKQKRFERHIEQALNILSKRIDVLEKNYASLSGENQLKFRTLYLEWLLDNIQVEKQTEKIPCHVNGYINLMSDEVNDNLMLMFFNTVNELTQLDIDVLKMYSVDGGDNIYALCEKYNLQPEQIMVIKEKLARLGLLQSKNDELRDANLDYVVDYLIDVDSENKKKNPRSVPLHKTKIKKIKRADTFHITGLGQSYLRIISE
ncbi:MAG: hypothetical protein IJA60_00825 [Clostridia bacterium]|nr:hypothetical protein [Clostridia bacterium]